VGPQAKNRIPSHRKRRVSRVVRVRTMSPLRVPLAVISLLVLVSAARAVPTVFTAKLSGLNEVEPNNSQGTGMALVSYDPVTHLLTVNSSFAGLTGTTTASHIHAPAPPGSNGMVATTTPTFPNFPLGVTSGTYANTFDMTLPSSYNPAFVTAHGGTVAQAEADLASALFAGLSYFNIHSSTFPGGEIRGQLLTSVADSGSTAVLFLSALVGLGALVRQRKK
jgi:hypothetical protein